MNNSSSWTPEDDLLLKSSIEAGASLEAIAKGAVMFSHGFTLHELRDRWHSLIYDPIVSPQASAYMFKVELSVSNPTSPTSNVDDLKGNEMSPNKRKWGSICRQYYAMRKRIKNAFFSSPGLGFSKKCSNHSHSRHGDNFHDHSTLDHKDQVGNDMNGDCLAKRLRFEEIDFETIGSITTTAIPDDAFRGEGWNNATEKGDINRSVREDGLCKDTENLQPSLKKIRLFDPSIKQKDETHMHKCDSGKWLSNEELGPSQSIPIGKILKASEFQAQPVLTYDSVNENDHILCSRFGGKHHVNLPGSDGSAESMVTEETLAPAKDSDTRRDNSQGIEASQSLSFLGDEPDGTDFIYSIAVSEREYENFPDSLMNFSNKDSLYVDVVSISAMDKNHKIPNSQLDSPGNVQEDSTFHVDQQGVCHWEADVTLSHPYSSCSEGNIICRLNMEDPEIPQLSEGDISCRLNTEDTEIPEFSEGDISCRLKIEDTSEGDNRCRLNIEDTEILQLSEWVISCRLNIEDTDIPRLSDGDISCRLNIEDTKIPQLSEWGISCRLNIEDTEIPQLSEGDISCRLNIEDTEIPQLSEGDISCRLNIEDTEIPQLSEGDISCRLNIEDTEIPQLSEVDISCRLNIEDTEIHQLSEGDISCRLNIEDNEIPQLSEWGISCRLNIEDTEIPQLSKGDISCRLNIEDTEIPQLSEWGISCRLNIEDTEIPQLSKGDISCRLNIEDPEIPQLSEWGISCRLNIEDTEIPRLSEGGVSCRSNIEDTEVPQPSEGICRLNLEDPEIPCNDDIFMLIHPSTSFDLSITSIATDSIYPSSSSEDENDDEQESSASKVPAPSFTQSQMVCLDSCSEFDFTHPLIGYILKSEWSDTKCLDPLSGQCDEIRDPGQPQYMLTNSVLIGDRGLTEYGLDDSETDSEVSLQTEVRSLKMIDPESMDDSSISDHNSADSDGDLPCFSDAETLTESGSLKMLDPKSMDDSFISDDNNADSDGDLPCFSDIDALIHGIGLEYSQDSCITSEAARHYYDHSNRTITRPQHTARSSLQRAMSSLGALAIFYSRHFDYYIKKTEVTIGRSTDDTDVDIDLRKEGCTNMISRRQATIKMDVDGSFTLQNIGKCSISMNGNSVAPGQVAALGSSCLIEIRGINFMFEINERYVRQYVNNIIKKSHDKTTTFEWLPEGEPRR